MSIVFVPITHSKRRVQDYYSRNISGWHLQDSKLNRDCDQFNATDLQITEEEVGIIIILRLKMSKKKMW